MNSIIKLFYSLLFSTLIVGCDLNRIPLDQLSEETAFVSYDNFQTYAWSFYSTFPGYALSVVNQDFSSDMMMSNSTNTPQTWLWNNVTIPSTSSSWSSPYSKVRKVNIMLDNIDGSTLSDSEKLHWESVGRFFRAYEYITLLMKYGGVPIVRRAITDADTDILYGPRSTRDSTANFILEDLTFAKDNIGTDLVQDGNNTVNRNVVLALISRFGLFEGTWRKYHGLSDETKYLESSVAASELLMAEVSVLMSNYDLIFNSENLKDQPGILLYKQYETNQITHNLTSRERNSTGNWDLTKSAVDLYLLKDGETRWTSSNFVTDKDPYEEFKSRDNRLYYTVVPPFKIYATGNVPDWQYISSSNTNGVTPEDSTRYRQYMDILYDLSDDQHKRLPTVNWKGLVVKQAPHFRDYNNGQGYNVSRTGYKLYKYFNQINYVQNQDINDAPVFRMGEVLVNHAEAMYELGRFDQGVADKTINRLRERGGVAPLSASVADDFDPTRDPDVPALLWEIRRERAVELMSEGYRFDDLRRWKKMDDYAAKEKLGRWVVNADYGNKLKIQNGADEGYISHFGVPPSFPDYYYLYPIPSDQIVLNPAIIQNPDWN